MRGVGTLLVARPSSSILEPPHHDSSCMLLQRAPSVNTPKSIFMQAASRASAAWFLFALVHMCFFFPSLSPVSHSRRLSSSLRPHLCSTTMSMQNYVFSAAALAMSGMCLLILFPITMSRVQFSAVAICATMQERSMHHIPRSLPHHFIFSRAHLREW